MQEVDEQDSLHPDPSDSVFRANPDSDKMLRFVERGVYSLLFKRSKGIEGRISRRVEEEILPLLTIRDTGRVRFSLELLLYNCFLAWIYQGMYSPNKIVVKYWRSRSNYGKGRKPKLKGRKRNKPRLKDLSYRTFMDVVGRLAEEELGYLELKTEKFILAENPKDRRLSWFAPTPKLIQLFQKHYDELKIVHHPQEHTPLVIKDKDKRHLDYTETPETRRIISSVEAINAEQEKHSYTLFIPETDLVQFWILPEPDAEGRIAVGALWSGEVAMLFENCPQALLCLTPKDKGNSTRTGSKLWMKYHQNSTPGNEVEAQSTSSSNNTNLLDSFFITYSNPYNLYIQSTSTNTTSSKYNSTTTSLFLITGNKGENSKIKKCRFLGEATAWYLPEQGGIEVSLSGMSKYHRVFNKGSLTLGGRFYAPIQGVPSKIRRYLRIDGKPTLEGDFNALHFRLVYATAMNRELSPYEDGYRITVEGWNDKDAVRKAMKKSVLLLLNAANRTKGLQAVQGEINRYKITVPKCMTAKHLEAAILKAHPDLGKYLYKGRGLGLMYIDSKIAETVLQIFTSTGKGIVCLHDGFRVAEDNADDLLLAMHEAYKSEVGFNAKIDWK